ncbi:MAG TPA: PDZ domain-containing protein [Kouleothrix sp.]|uniref:PDZ domain-containing protein n=1 Tax=Kouleothrix sp. TaxID=2779161 RepID=UPI002C056A97|nr:PDZ domain-containing protein [Kouleothrix sp.]
MRFERRVRLPWLIAGAAGLCVWCAFLSGLGGWIMGRDLAGREQQAIFATQIAERKDLPPLGVLVTRLDRTGPAARGGVQRGDTIVAIDGKHLQDARDLREYLRTLHPNDTVRLTVLRDIGGENDVSLKLDPFPGDSRLPYLGVYFTARGDEPADL